MEFLILITELPNKSYFKIIFIPSSTKTKSGEGSRQVKLRNKKLVNCVVCNKPGYSYGTYYQHYNEPPVGKIKLRGKIIGDKFRRCYLPKEIAKTGTKKHLRQLTTSTDSQLKPSLSRPQLKMQLTTQTLDVYVKSTKTKLEKPSNGRNVLCPACRHYGLLNVATHKNDLRKISFYMKHEKLDGMWGNKSKVSKYRRCYISTRNTEQMRYLKKIWKSFDKSK